MTVRFDTQVVDLALTQLGTVERPAAPYLWAGRGDWAVRDNRVVPVALLGVVNSLAFDCAGLVTWAAWRCGAKDLRGWWGADHLWRNLPLRESLEPLDAYRLVFYGEADVATHVAIDLGSSGLVLEAAGGGSKTLTYADAKKTGARVRVTRERRQDRLGWRSLLAMQSLPERPP